MKQLSTEEVLELRKRERILIDDRMQELHEEAVVKFLFGRGENK